MDLRLEMRIKPQAIEFDYTPFLDIWCLYEVVLISEDATEQLLVYQQWDFVVFCEWVADNAKFWCTESLLPHPTIPPKKHAKGSLADQELTYRVRGLCNVDEGTEDDWYEYLWHYRSHHNIKFGLAGSRVPNMLIGCNKGQGEISLNSGDGTRWHYNISLKLFIENLLPTLEQILVWWSDNIKDEREVAIIADFRARLAQIETKACA